MKRNITLGNTLDVAHAQAFFDEQTQEVVVRVEVEDSKLASHLAQSGAAGFDGREAPSVHFPTIGGKWSSIDISSSWKPLQRNNKTFDAYEIRLGKNEGLDFVAAQKGVAINLDTNVAIAALQTVGQNIVPLPHSIEQLATISQQDFAEAETVLKAYSQSARAQSLSAGLKKPNANWNRGVLQAQQQHVGHGSLFTVYTGHEVANDRLTLSLEYRTGSRFVTLKTLAQDVRPNNNPDRCFEGVKKIYVSDIELETAIKQHFPTMTLDEAVQKGQFAVGGVWSSRHTWGGFNRQGEMDFVTKNGVTSAEPVIKVGLDPNASTVSLDVTVPISTTLKSKYSVFNTPQAAFMSHLEAEGKARVPLTRFKALYEQLNLVASHAPQDAAAKAQAMQAIFGNEAADWEVERVSKYDPQNVAIVPDKHGMLPVNPFYDVYLDNKQRSLAKHAIALRIRRVAGEKNDYAQVNYKPGPGIRDNKTNVSRRVETELIVDKSVAENPSLLNTLLCDTNQPLNPHNLGNAWAQKEVGAPIPVLSAADGSITEFSGLGVNRRYKFEFTNKKTLVAFEASLDLCATLALDAKGFPLTVDANGKPDPNGTFYAVSVFAQLEPEANHMAGVTAPGTTTTPPAPAFNGVPLKPQAPEIRIHGLTDLSSPLFDQDPGYVQFDKTMPSFQRFLFGADIGQPGGAEPTEQKNAIGQRLAGAIDLTPSEQQKYAQELAATAEFRAAIVPHLAPTVNASQAEMAKRAALSRYPYSATTSQTQVTAREAIWEAFAKLNPLDFIDLSKLP